MFLLIVAKYFALNSRVNTDDMNTITRVGILHLMIGDTQIAFTKLLDALAIDDRNPKILLALGGILQVSICVFCD